MSSLLKPNLKEAVILLTCIGIDQLSKGTIRHFGLTYTGSFLSIGVYPNTNGAFSLPISPTLAILFSFLAITLLVLAYIFVKSQLTIWGIIFITAGGISNLIDRFYFGAVIDVAHIANASFNGGDILIISGGIIILITLFIRHAPIAAKHDKLSV